MTRTTNTANPMARVAGALLPILVAALLVPFRERLTGATMVLILVVVVVGVATTGDRLAALIAAVIAAASFDFFLTKPYTSMRITSAQDIETAFMLLVIGLLVGQLGSWGSRRRAEANRARDELHRMELVADRIASDGGALGLLDMVEREIVEMMDLASCRYSLSQPPVPVMLPDGSIDSTTHALVEGEFALPSEGVGIRVDNGGETLGWLHLVPGDRLGVPRETRKVAIALSQQLGTALARSSDAGTSGR
jgi:K+-sensing histidine kinase KdpD